MIATSELPWQEVTTVVATVLLSAYGDDAQTVVALQIEAADGEMRERWIAIRNALGAV